MYIFHKAKTQLLRKYLKLVFSLWANSIAFSDGIPESEEAELVSDISITIIIHCVWSL